ncbi:epoxide hydrolase N-terminal domain-containing protein [Spirillospora sp. CA-128828]|uniref:epoxide hydrolase N-terminal domain-containing protein n=1 Tax=Spirillospora sp. CA-128828 TaxID=3240033 RepID=UPI003D910DBE
MPSAHHSELQPKYTPISFDDSAKEKPVADDRPPIAVSDADLEDLRARLRATRWPIPWPLDAWQAGTDSGELRRLVEYWATDFDWRAHEAALNALPSHIADVDGTPRPLSAL